MRLQMSLMSGGESRQNKCLSCFYVHFCLSGGEMRLQNPANTQIYKSAEVCLCLWTRFYTSGLCTTSTCVLQLLISSPNIYHLLHRQQRGTASSTCHLLHIHIHTRCTQRFQWNLLTKSHFNQCRGLKCHRSEQLNKSEFALKYYQGFY